MEMEIENTSMHLLLKGFYDSSDSNFKDFWFLQLKHLREIQIEPEIPHLQQIWKRLQFKSCYENAINFLDHYKDSLYCEGYILTKGIIPIRHAWNKYKNTYYDITARKFFSEYMTDKYFLILEVSRENAWKIIAKNKMKGELLEGYYNHFIRNKDDFLHLLS